MLSRRFIQNCFSFDHWLVKLDFAVAMLHFAVWFCCYSSVNVVYQRTLYCSVCKSSLSELIFYAAIFLDVRCSFSKLLLLWPPLTYKFYFLTASYFNPITIQTRSSKSKLSGYYCFLQSYLPMVWLWFWLQTSCRRWIQYGGLSKNFVRTALERWVLAWNI